LQWWHCLRESPIDLDQLTAKQRYRIRKGLKNNDNWLATPQDIMDNAEEILQAYQDSFSDYPKVYKPAPLDIEQVNNLARLVENPTQDIWLIRDIAANTIVGFAHCSKIGKALALSQVKIAPQYLKNESNAALVYEICNHYLKPEMGFEYVLDGERNIRHRTNYQDYLCRVLSFRKCLCRLHVVYHPVIKPVVAMLYPFRKLIAKIEESNRLIYNVSCILRQEEIARACR